MVYFLSFVFFALAITGLSLGLLSGREGIRGSCGGLNNPDGHGCGVCGRAAADDCPRRLQA